MSSNDSGHGPITCFLQHLNEPYSSTKAENILSRQENIHF